MMTFTEDGLSIEHTTAVRWINWYSAMLKRAGATAAECNGVTKQLSHFFQSGPIFTAQQDWLRCEACHGRGHNNLTLLGSDGPTPCSVCDGVGLKPSGD